MSKEFKLTYIRDTNRNPIGCLVYSVKDNQIKWQISCCNLAAEPCNKDQAREKAFWRFHTNPKTLQVSAGGSTALTELYQHMLHDPEIPGRIKRALRKGWGSPDKQTIAALTQLVRSLAPDSDKLDELLDREIGDQVKKCLKNVRNTIKPAKQKFLAAKKQLIHQAPVEIQEPVLESKESRLESRVSDIEISARDFDLFDNGLTSNWRN